MKDELPPEVELVEPVEPVNPEPARAAFEEQVLPAEPASDVKLVLGGTRLRERIERVPHSAETIRTKASDVAAPGFTLVISHALLDEDDRVARDADGAVRIAPVHEISFSGERLGRMGTPAAIERALRHGREVAAADARRFFTGIALGEQLLAGRMKGAKS